MIPTGEELLPLHAVPNLPSALCRRPRGETIHYITIYRWATRGLANGHKLESVMAGGRIYTSREAVDRFFDATSQGVCAPARPETPATVGANGGIDRAVENRAAQTFIFDSFTLPAAGDRAAGRRRPGSRASHRRGSSRRLRGPRRMRHAHDRGHL
jgi:hypothetical protein